MKKIPQENTGNVSPGGGSSDNAPQQDTGHVNPGGGSTGHVTLTRTDVDNVPQHNTGCVRPVPRLRTVGGLRRISLTNSVGEYLQTAGMSDDLKFQLEMRRMQIE